MEQVLNFIKDNWYLISLLGVCVCNLFLIIFKKKVKVVDSIFSQVLQELPFIISTVEKQFGSGNGKEKLNLVLYKAIEYICSNSDLTQNQAIKKYYDQLVVCIEAILSTPKKKEEY